MLFCGLLLVLVDLDGFGVCLGFVYIGWVVGVCWLVVVFCCVIVLIEFVGYDCLFVICFGWVFDGLDWGGLLLFDWLLVL